jgi:hypothetical protein
MMPVNSSGAASGGYSGLQSANMVSNVQSSSSKQSYTSYKVQSNSYTSGGDRIDHEDRNSTGDRPGSRLKANIDELDTLLSDLNNAQQRGGGGGSSANSHQQHNSRHDNFVSSSEDYGSESNAHLQGHVKKTITSLNEYTTSGNQGQGIADYNRKPPSPSPKRRTPQPPVMSSPATARRTSPSPSGRRGASPPHGMSTMSSTNNYSSNSYNYNSRGSSPPRKRSPSPRFDSNTPTGHAYYSKYHSSYSNSQNQNSGGPMSFPTCPSPRPGGGPSLQTPPKKVDDLMTELSEFDPSIQHTSFTEPSTSRTTTTKYTMHSNMDEDDYPRPSRREPSPIRPSKQPSTPGPAVYYPPGELFSSTRNDTQSETSTNPQPMGQVSHATTLESSGGRGRAKARAEYGYKEKGRYQDSDGKQGAAVIPICLPLCCAAPCVIL